MQARTHSRPVKNIACGIEIAIERQPADWTVVSSVAEAFRDFSAAARTILGSVLGIDLDHRGTSLCSFVPHERDESCPGSVVDIAGETPAREPFHIESFNRNDVIVSDESRSALMQVVQAPPCRSRVAARYLLSRLASALRRALLTA